MLYFHGSHVYKVDTWLLAFSTLLVDPQFHAPRPKRQKTPESAGKDTKDKVRRQTYGGTVRHYIGYSSEITWIQ